MKSEFRELAADSLKYWEPRRLIYNAILACVVLGYAAAAWPRSKATLSFDSVLFLFMLTVLANVCYCAVYAVDLFVQLSGLRELWLQRRWLLFVIGTAFAGVITRFAVLLFFLQGS